MTQTTHTIGILSGTSMDAIDVALVAHHGSSCTLTATHSHPIPSALKQTLQGLCQPNKNEINHMGACDTELGYLFATAITTLLKQHPKIKVSAIGSHGQTIRHHPNLSFPFSLQIANAHIIAEQTGISTISDFRQHDMANGGQGAPLAPIFHQQIFWQANQPTAVINIGGMANASLLDGDDQTATIGFDTGPGNCLMDAWIMQHQGKAFDDKGQWARSGQVIPDLLAKCLAHPFFNEDYPKSTGHEQFHLAWLTPLIPAHSAANDVQRTLLELTAQSIAKGITMATKTIQNTIVCGGGAYNQLLYERIADLHPACQVSSSQDWGIAPAWVEAMMFAWLAQQHQLHHALDLRQITGARQASVLGVAYRSQ